MKTSWKYAVAVGLASLVVVLMLYGGEGRVSAAPVVREMRTFVPRMVLPEPGLPPGHREFAVRMQKVWSVLYTVPADRTLYITDVCVVRSDATRGTPFVALMHGSDSLLDATPFLAVNVAVGQNAIASFQTPVEIAGGEAFSVAVPSFLPNPQWQNQMDIWCFVRGYEE